MNRLFQTVKVTGLPLWEWSYLKLLVGFRSGGWFLSPSYILKKWQRLGIDFEIGMH